MNLHLLSKEHSAKGILRGNIKEVSEFVYEKDLFYYFENKRDDRSNVAIQLVKCFTVSFVYLPVKID